MSKATSLGIGLGCLIAAGCDQRHPTAVTPSSVNTPMSMEVLDGVVGRRIPIRIGGEDIEATVFAKDLGDSALFLCYYSLPARAEEKQARDAAVEAEIERCVANVGAEVVSREAFPNVEHSTSEVVAKSEQKRSHSIRCRVICTGQKVHSLTAITPDAHDVNYQRALDQMFEDFHVD